MAGDLPRKLNVELAKGITLVAGRKWEGGRLVQCYTLDCPHAVQELTSRPVAGSNPTMSINSVLFAMLLAPGGQDCSCVRRAWQRGHRGWNPLLRPLKRELRESALPRRRWAPVVRGDEAE